MKKAHAFLIVAAVCLTSPAMAQNRQTSGFFSTAYLAALCERDAKGKEIVENGHTACQSYIASIVDYQKLMQSMNVAPIIDFCVPNTVSMNRLQDVVWAYLRQNSQHAQFIAAPAVTLALSDAYPCKKKAPLTRKHR